MKNKPLKHYDLAIVCNSLVQFFSIRNGADAFINKGLKVIFYTIDPTQDPIFGSMYRKTHDYIEALGYTAEFLGQSSPKTSHKIVLSAYLVDTRLLTAGYYIKYLYGAMVSSKPDPVVFPDSSIWFDAILCHCELEKNLLSTYAPTFVIPRLNFIGFERDSARTSCKPNLLYLPTWEDISSVEEIVPAIQKLKNKYRIVTKSHHGTVNLASEESRRNTLNDIADEVHDDTTDMTDLLKTADIVLSDNSGAIMEAMYAEVPVAVFSKNPNARYAKGYNTIHYDLISEGVIPYTDSHQHIDEVLVKGMSKKYIQKQKTARDTIFGIGKIDTGKFVDIIEKYLHDDINLKQKYLHDLLVDDMRELQVGKAKIATLSAGRVQLEAELSAVKNELSAIRSELSTVNKGKKPIVGYTCGSYDMFHIGHLNILKKAKSQCDYLIVGVNSDEAIFNIKGKKPIVSCSERAEIVSAIKFVDEVSIVGRKSAKTFPSDYELRLKSDVVIMADEYKDSEEWTNFEKELNRRGGKMIYFPYTKTTSSTQLRAVLDEAIKYNNSQK